MEKQCKGHSAHPIQGSLSLERSQDLGGDPHFRRMPCLRDSDCSAGAFVRRASRSLAAACSLEGEVTRASGSAVPCACCCPHTGLVQPALLGAAATLSSLCWATRPSGWRPLRSDPHKGGGCEVRKAAQRLTHTHPPPPTHREGDARGQEMYCLDVHHPQSFSI